MGEEQKVQDDFRGVGGTYVIENGVRKLVEPSAEPTATGGARDEHGNPIVDAAGPADKAAE